MLKLQQKLKHTKNNLKEWAKHRFGKGNKQSTLIRKQFISVHQRIMNQSSDPALSTLENDLTARLSKAMKTETSMLKQKARENWNLDGDRNTKFYHATLKIKQTKSLITSILDQQGTTFSTSDSLTKHS